MQIHINMYIYIINHFHSLIVPIQSPVYNMKIQYYKQTEEKAVYLWILLYITDITSETIQ